MWGGLQIGSPIPCLVGGGADKGGQVLLELLQRQLVDVHHVAGLLPVISLTEVPR